MEDAVCAMKVGVGVLRVKQLLQLFQPPQWEEVDLRIPPGCLEDSPSATCQPQAVPGCFSTE